MLILACLPIGDARDASTHLIESIQNATYVAAEDSRKFARLCQELNIKHHAKVITFFEGNESEKIDELTSLLKSQKDVLVVTDAGAPGVSDPGYRLIRAAVESDVKIKVLPGPSAVVTALLLSGLPTDRFCFEGFPPRTQGARSKWFNELAQEERTIIFFEAPHRIVESLKDAGDAFGLDRIVTMMTGAESIRDVIAFPKTQRAQCLLTQAPSPVDEKQLRELHIRLRNTEMPA